MSDINRITLEGRLTKDPIVRATKTGRVVVNFSMACNRSYKDAKGEWHELTDFANVVAWSVLAEEIANRVKKGDPISVEGRLYTEKYEDKYYTKVHAERASIPLPTYRRQENESNSVNDFEEMGTVVTGVSNEEIPF